MNLLNQVIKAASTGYDILAKGIEQVDKFEVAVCDKVIPNNNGRDLDSYYNPWLEKQISNTKAQINSAVNRLKK